MPHKAETDIVRDILAWVEKQGGDGFHVHGSAMQRRGEPDIDCSLPDGQGGWLHIKCEAKTDQNEPSPQQRYRLAGYASRGYLAFFVRSLQEFIKHVETHRASLVEPSEGGR